MCDSRTMMVHRDESLVRPNMTSFYYLGEKREKVPLDFKAYL